MVRLWRHWSSSGLLACLSVAAAAARTAFSLNAVWTLTSTGVIRVESERVKAREGDTESIREEEESTTTAIGFACQQGCAASEARAERFSSTRSATSLLC